MGNYNKRGVNVNIYERKHNRKEDRKKNKTEEHEQVESALRNTSSNRAMMRGFK